MRIMAKEQKTETTAAVARESDVVPKAESAGVLAPQAESEVIPQAEGAALPAPQLESQEAPQADVPTFALRADKPGHLRALVALICELPWDERREAEGILRQFELYEEATRLSAQ